MTDPRTAAHQTINRLHSVPETDLVGAARAAIDRGCVWSVSAPVGDLTGPEAVAEAFVRPLRRALGRLRRREEIFIGAENRLAPGFWVASVAHYVGVHEAPLWGVPPSGHLAYLRAGEFFRIEAGRIVEGKIIVDLIDLMRQAGRGSRWGHLGTEVTWPGPATHDGVLPQGAGGAASLDVVEAMARDLHDYDPATMGSRGQTGDAGYWRPDFLWHGPGGIGSTVGWESFVADHRRPFLQAFPDRRGGNHYARIGDGNFAAFSGWPSMTMTHRGEYLGVPATGRALTLNVMDFYRIEGGQIAENWVCLDYVGLLAQMGVDVIAEAAAWVPSAAAPARAGTRPLSP